LEAKNAVWNGLKGLISSELCIKIGIAGERNHNESKNGGCGMYLFMEGENAQINSVAED
jgi:hypothetical protein